MIDLENISYSANSIYVLRYRLGELDVDDIVSCFNKLKKTFRENNMDNPLIAIPLDTVLQSLSKKELINIRDTINKLISDLD